MTTIAHTSGVFVLGLVALLASHYWLPEQFYPVLELVSGLLVVGIGAKLLRERLFSLSNAGSAELHSHTVPDKVYTLSHTHHYDERHSHTYIHSHSELDESQSLGTVISLGIAGGMVPCPAALVLLLSAIALHQTVYGMALVSTFSLGLAIVLVAIGICVIYARQWCVAYLKAQCGCVIYLF